MTPKEMEIALKLNEWLPKEFIGTMRYWNLLRELAAMFKDDKLDS